MILAAVFVMRMSLARFVMESMVMAVHGGVCWPLFLNVHGVLVCIGVNVSACSLLI